MARDYEQLPPSGGPAPSLYEETFGSGVTQERPTRETTLYPQETPSEPPVVRYPDIDREGNEIDPNRPPAPAVQHDLEEKPTGFEIKLQGGYTKTLTEDKYIKTRSQYNDELAMLFGGRTAEELIFNELTTGAQSDIKQATNLARKMVTDFGMSDKLGPRTFGHKEELVFLGREISEQRNYGDKVADLIDEEVHNIIRRGYEVAWKILINHKAKLIHIAEKLVTQETLEGEELESLFSEPTPSSLPEVKATPASKPARATSKTRTKTNTII